MRGQHSARLHLPAPHGHPPCSVRGTECCWPGSKFEREAEQNSGQVPSCDCPSSCQRWREHHLCGVCTVERQRQQAVLNPGPGDSKKTRCGGSAAGACRLRAVGASRSLLCCDPKWKALLRDVHTRPPVLFPATDASMLPLMSSPLAPPN